MQKNRFFVFLSFIVFIVFFVTGDFAQSSDACTQIFSVETPSSYKINFQEDSLVSKNTNDSLKTLLQLANQSRYMNLGKKNTLEKGEMILGYDLGNGESLELTYTGDKRSHNGKFVLTRVDFVHKNSVVETLSRSPLTPDTLSFSSEPIQFQSRTIELPNKEFFVKIPTVIQDKPLVDFLKFATHMEHLKRDEISEALKKDNVKSLIRKSNIRKLVKFLKFDLAKQTFRNVVFGGIVFFATHMGSQSGAPTAPPTAVPTPVESTQKVEVVREMIIFEFPKNLNNEPLYYMLKQ